MISLASEKDTLSLGAALAMQVQRGEDPQSGGLSQRHQPDRGGDQVRGEALEVGGDRIVFPDAVVRGDGAIKSIPDLIAEAKKRPGALSFGSPGVGTAGHLIGELFKSRAGVELVHVPYRGQSQVINDLLGGHLAMSFEAVATAIPVVQNGNMRGLATTCPVRSPQIPDVPTFAEVGVKDFAIEALALVAVHAKTPQPVVTRLNEAVVKIINGPNVSKRIAGMGLIAKSSTPEQARAMLTAEVARWRQVVETAKIPPMD